MPYKRRGRTVYVKRGDRWLKLKTHSTVAKAMAHLKALYANVEEAKKKG